jgi:deoxyribose-phosphate aldolase
MPVATSILSTIDHAVLAPDATRDDVLRGCELAARLGVASVCVQPRWVPTAVAALADWSVAVGTVAGFPLGATTTEAKTLEAMQAFGSGATEVDMVMAVTAFKSGDYDDTLVDMAMVVQVARESGVSGAMVKAILEMCYLTEEEKRVAAELAVRAGVDFVKTSTGMGPGGATVEDVALLREIAPESVGVKAAGGIRDLERMREMLNAGASRIGASATEAIAAELGVGD